MVATGIATRSREAREEGEEAGFQDAGRQENGVYNGQEIIEEIV